MWTIGYSQEVRNYIFDSYPYTAEIWQQIKSLRQTSNGLPESGWKIIEPGLYLWVVAGHSVIYKRLIEERKIVVTVLKPFDDIDHL